MKTIKQAFENKYPKYAKRILEVYELANGFPIEWENITMETLYEFSSEMKSQVSANSARTYLAMMKSVLNLYTDQVQLPIGWDKTLNSKGEAVVSTWLTDMDIEKIIDYAPKTDVELNVKNQFILGCLTGARHVDYCQFDEGNINGKNLVYVSKKTRIKSVLPLAPAAERILLYEPHEMEFTTKVFNSTIKRICKHCGITEEVRIFHAGHEQTGEKWRFVSSHTARRSFATNVYLRCKDIFLVSRYMGHASVDMTARYILDIGEAPEEVKKYFNKFK